MREAHIGHEWDSSIVSSSEEVEKVATIAIHEPSSSPRLFTNMFDDDYYSPHICLMAKGEKVKSKSKVKAPPPPPPSDISSSDNSDSSSDDKSSDEEINMITKNLDGKTKLFITKANGGFRVSKPGYNLEKRLLSNKRISTLLAKKLLH